jgi:hypothetical protein
MTGMQVTFRPGAALAIAIAVAVAACGGPAPSAVPAGSAMPATPTTASMTAGPTPVLTEGPPPTVVPVPSSGPATDPQEPAQPPGEGATDTEWGAILDVVPDGFPVIPGAKPAEGLDEPASGWWLAEANVDDVASWYQGALGELGFTVGDLSSPLEDGSRVLDVSSDLPECRLQLAFRPAGGSTIIMVLYGAGCAGGEG